ncbi:MAG: beta-ketoacyl-[acyl-carrier-protein] synthase family protein [Myxococcales bacterium FL481]|nr:MAG: beta-ketoacyl-[acyl-carrier-protein] synthase family protein [Myxococcales bacterium FL481]
MVSEFPARRVVVTGMGINTPLGDELDSYYDGLIAGTSAITKWKFFDHPGVYSRVGGDLSEYDVKAKLARLRPHLPESMFRRMRQLVKKAPMSTAISMTCAADAWLDAQLDGIEGDTTRRSVIVGGHNLNERYTSRNFQTFLEEPDYIDSMSALLMLDTDHAGSVSEVLGWHGAAFTVGGACASANVALRTVVDDIRHHGQDLAMLVGPVLDFSPMGVHSMAMMGAIAIENFNDRPTEASRPYDVRREGFVPSHGAGALVLEELEHARRRGARIYAEVLGCVATSDGCHQPSPSVEGQTRTIHRLFEESRVAPEEIDFVSAHATSTQLGDRCEIQAIGRAFGRHAPGLKINAPKSMLGHTCWSAPAVETIAALLQLQRGKLHGSMNIETLDPEIDLDVCANQATELSVRVLLKNSFGFGGINCCALFGHPEYTNAV